ncbi:hypothetical protein CNMCM5793_000207 [Aspergillus hiratsukae]|uniref:Uncharacterized protein n=1 Tax=Aspergillus hiratsukae TaxID=1194566 RepID=A0A8H6Q1G8_9EURO|nr:hypothetical protein CNMCM5793_000207 [Aspergillus hiratsukae]KAF7164049.1 hypothetical protein CNMCM6106_000743 [Aspergillus hiratsukae]
MSNSSEIVGQLPQLDNDLKGANADLLRRFERQGLRQRRERQETINQINEQCERIQAITQMTQENRLLTTEELIRQQQEELAMKKFNESQRPSRSRLEALLEWFLSLTATQEAHSQDGFERNTFIMTLDGDASVLIEVPGRWFGFLNSELEHTIQCHAGPVKWATRVNDRVQPNTFIVTDYSQAYLKRRVGNFLLCLNREWVTRMTKILGNTSFPGGLFCWTMPNDVSYANLRCFSYDLDNTPMLLKLQEVEREEVIDPVASVATCLLTATQELATINEVNGAYGKVWVVKHEGDILTVDSLLFLICQLYQTFGETDPGVLATLRSPVSVFLKSYLDDWQWYPKLLYEEEMKHQSLQIHFRVFSVSGSNRIFKSLQDLVETGQCLAGVRCRRNRHRVPVPSRSNNDVELVESRCSVYLSTLCLSDRPVYLILSLLDFGRPGSPLRGATRSSKCLTGVVMFLAIISDRLDDWQHEWESVLDLIDRILATEMQEILHTNTQEELMYERSLITIKSYFTILQTLRVCKAWIHEVPKDLDRMSYEVRTVHNGVDLESFNSSWDRLSKHSGEIVEKLLSRIGQIEEEFKSLQDGLMNITSVVESTKSSTMNRYILVFTVATILYLPMGFVASIFGMHLFDYPRLEQTQRSFYITMVLASVITYLIATLAIFGIRQHMRIKGTEQARRWKDSWNGLSELVSRDSFKQWDLAGPFDGNDGVPSWDSLTVPRSSSPIQESV